MSLLEDSTPRKERVCCSSASEICLCDTSWRGSKFGIETRRDQVVPIELEPNSADEEQRGLRVDLLHLG